MTASAPPAIRALVVDDGPLNRKLVSGLLTQLGCEVETASSAAEALVKCASGAYDVAYLDLQMPGMDGREMAIELRALENEERAPRLPIVVLTADDAPPPGDQSWFDMFVSKPITSALLKASLQLIVAPPSQQPTLFRPAPIHRADEFIHATRNAVARMKNALAEEDFASVAAEASGVTQRATSFGASMVSALGAVVEQNAKGHSRDGVVRGLRELERSLASSILVAA